MYATSTSTSKYACTTETPPRKSLSKKHRGITQSERKPCDHALLVPNSRIDKKRGKRYVQLTAHYIISSGYVRVDDQAFLPSFFFEGLFLVEEAAEEADSDALLW
jgi:hypothetical protein